MRRPSTSSASSVSTAYSYTKDEPDKEKATKAPRRGLRQKARDVVSDLGNPPTTRQDTKDGKHTSQYIDLGAMGADTVIKTGTI